MAESNDISQKTLNAAQVKALFEEKCCLFGNSNGVSVEAAAELFGTDVIQEVLDIGKPGKTFNTFTIRGKCSVDFLYFSGFAYAATLSNVIKLSEHRPVLKKEWEKNPDGKLADFPDGEKRKRGNA